MTSELTSTERPALALARKGAVAVIAAVLLWFVGVQGLAAIAAKSSSPALLQLFDPSAHPAAANQLARIYLAARQPAQASALARAATFADPMEVRVVRTLGQALETNDKAAAARVMRAAETLSWRDTPTSLWVLRDAALQANLPRVMDQIDALARRQVEPKLVQQIYYASLADATSRRAFAEALAKNPPWRGNFFADARIHLPPQSTAEMAMLLDLLDRTKSPPTRAERMTFIDRTVDAGDGQTARAYWARTFGIAPGALAQVPYDPVFRSVATRGQTAPVSPFEWKIGADSDQFIAFRRGDAGYLLDVNPATDAGLSLIAQTLLLAPGPHRIDANIVQGEAPRAPAEWQISCASSGTPLIRSFATQGNDLSGVTVVVPPTGCSVQTLALVTIDRIDSRSVTIASVTVR